MAGKTVEIYTVFMTAENANQSIESETVIWTEQDYRIIHHDAEYITVHHEAEGFYETVVIIDAYDEIKPAWDEQVLIREAYDEVVNEAWDETVITKDAWDETVEVPVYEPHAVCDACGFVFDTEGYTQTQLTEHMKMHAVAGEPTSWGDRDIQIGTTEVTVCHEAEYTTVHHDAEIVHHEAEYRTIHHDSETIHHEAVTEEKWIEIKPAWDEQVLVREAYDEVT